MTHGFQHQDPMIGFAIPKSALVPQHGQKARPADGKIPEPRSFQPRPGR